MVGCDGLDSAAFTTPPLSTVRVPFYDIGVEAMRVLLRAVSGETARARTVSLPVHLIVRESTATRTGIAS
jgi:LacI family transcriptional regulator